MKALLDVGNSCVKAICYALTPDWQQQTQLPAGQVGDWLIHNRVSECWVASVGNSQLTEQLAALPIQLHPVVSEASFGGVSNSYREPHLLGVDRWLTLVAAYSERACSALILDLGSAMTADLIDARGQHLGGWIAPGVAMMGRALNQGTARLPAGAIPAADTARCFATDTVHAIAAGIGTLVNCFCTQAYQQSCEVLGAEPARIILTGGDAARVSADVSAHCEYCPELVLKGLACYADAENMR